MQRGLRFLSVNFWRRVFDLREVSVGQIEDPEILTVIEYIREKFCPSACEVPVPDIRARRRHSTV
jgi:hypothetical protein